MKLGERLYEYRKAKGFSQEEVASRLNVSRQTISKWETDQSLPDFDKIVPICELFNIDAEELLNGKRRETITQVDTTNNHKQKATVISVSIFLYFLSIVWVALGEELFNINDGINVSIFIVICAISTINLIYYFIANPLKKEIVKKKYKRDIQPIISVISIIFTIIYFLVSFTTFAWHISWIIWLIYALVVAIIKLIYSVEESDGEDDE